MTTPPSRSDGPRDALVELARALLLERSEHYEDKELVAYLDGWSAVLDLLEKSSLAFPSASPQFRAALADCVQRLRRIQDHALADEERGSPCAHSDEIRS